MAVNFSCLKKPSTNFCLPSRGKSRLSLKLGKQAHQMQCKIIKHLSISVVCGFQSRTKTRNGVDCGDDKLDKQIVATCNSVRKSHSGKIYSTKKCQTVKVSVYFTNFYLLKP